MRLYSYEVDGKTRLGAEKEEGLVDLSEVAPDLIGLIRGGPVSLEAARQVVRSADPVHPLERARILAPLRPGKILCSGINYASHVQENPNAKMPQEPFFFAKLPSSVVGPGDPIRRGPTAQLDYEVELCAVIGQSLPVGTPGDAAAERIFGYTLLNDVSARDVQFKDNQITLGKNFAGFAPIGPCVVTRDELSDPNDVRLRTWLNGQLMQDGSTREWIFKLPQLLGYLLRYMPLEPGDLVSTGTPAGVGFFRKPPVFMQPGDVVVVEAEGIGRLENPVEA